MEHVTVDGVHVTNGGRGAISCNGKYITCKNNVVSDIFLNGFLDLFFIDAGTCTYGTSFFSTCWENRTCSVFNNRIENIGYSGMALYGTGMIAYSNFVNNTCTITDDCGSIYTSGSWHLIYDNLFMNSIGNSIGTDDHFLYNKTYDGSAQGIYFDDWSNNQTAIGNVVINCEYTLQIHNSPNNVIKDNLLLDYRSVGYHISEDTIVNIFGFNRENIVRNNVFFSLKEGSKSISCLANWQEATSLRGFNWDANSMPVYPGYEFNPFFLNFIEPSLFENGEFETGITGWWRYGASTTPIISWDETEKAFKSVIPPPNQGQIMFAISPHFK